MNYTSTFELESSSCPGVRLRLRRMSYGRRLELLKQVREIVGRMEYFNAGSSAVERIEAATLSAELEQLYLKWGVDSIEGLTIDGNPADGAALFDSAPESL
jgi:hypothetical protein